MNEISYSAICCYFGQWPNYFQLWLNSCGYNSGIDFWLVTDIPMEGLSVPQNVKVLSMSFEDLRSRIVEVFKGEEICFERPYKICDFRPAYPEIFPEIVNQYDYWGYFDIDTLWGDILKFLPENSDKRYNKLLPCGHLSFLKNCPLVNTLYRQSEKMEGIRSWREVFSHPDAFYFDEDGGLEPLAKAVLKDTYWGGIPFDNVLPPWKFDHFYSINYPEKSRFLVYSYESGKLFRHYLKGYRLHKEEICYLHFSRRQVHLVVNQKSGNYCFYPNRIVPPIEWNLMKLLLHGRKRYIRHFIAGIVQKCGLNRKNN